MSTHAVVWLQMRRARDIVTFLFSFAIIFFESPVGLLAQTQTGPSSEDQVKARYLANIAKFVEWPENVFASPNAPFVIGIVGHYFVGFSLGDAIAGKTIHGRKVQIRLKKAGEDLRDCQMVFIGASQKGRLDQILKPLLGAHVLAVGESEGFLEAGGALNFVMEGQRVRFDANLAAATRENLRISSQLLMVARIVLNGRSMPKTSGLLPVQEVGGGKR